MKNLFTFLFCYLLYTSTSSGQSVPLVPNPLQKQVIKRGYGLFMHFGINTFNQIEWSDGTLPVSSYNPTALNCDQWIADAKEAGARHVVLTVKHHDGFCLWDSKYTAYDVAASPVKTDVVKAVADACKKYGVQFGVYYSLWDRHEPSYKSKDKKEYIKYMKNQLTELLTNYGPVCELWFDGAWDRTAEGWDVQGLYDLTKKLQPNCAFTFNHTIGIGKDVNGVGQPRNFKEGDIIRFFPVDFRTKDPNLVRWDDPKIYSYNGQAYYLPFEHTICLSDRWNWFQKKDTIPARPLDELEQLFYWCTANDNALLLNYPPDQTGQHRENERKRLFELADRLGIRGGKQSLPKAKANVAMNQKITATSATLETPADKANDTSIDSYWMAADTKASLEISFNETEKIRQISLMEFADRKDLGDKFSYERTFRATAFNVEAYNGRSWAVVHQGTTIGACKTFKLENPVLAQKIKINILSATKPVGINHILMQ